MTESRAYRVSGRVQGVGFRQWTRRTAERLDVAGTVRNAPDGSVEVQARGTHSALEEFERALSRGPLAARVQSVDRLPAALDHQHEGFRVVS